MSVIGGLEKVLASLANAFCARYNVHLLSVCATQGEPKFMLNPQIHYRVINEKPERLRILALRSFKFIKRYLKENKIDIVILMGNYPIPIALPVMPFSRAKFIYCDHGSLLNQWENKKITLFRFLASKLCRMTVTLTQRNKEDYKGKFRIPERKLDYIYNWIEEDVLSRSGEYNQNSKKIVTAGRFGPEKGFDMLVQVADKVLRANPDWSWDLYGAGETFESVKAQAESLGLTGRLNFMGETTQMLSLYKNYALYVLPSYREGLPLVLLEAKANSLPIVSFNCLTGPAEIVRHGVNGYLINCYDINEMANKINELISNPELRCRFAAAAKLDMDKFSKEAILQKWISLLDRL